MLTETADRTEETFLTETASGKFVENSPEDALPFARCAVMDPGAPTRRFTRTRVPSIRFTQTGETPAPQLNPTPPPTRMPEPVLSTDARDLADGTRNIDSVTTAEAGIRARVEQVRQLSPAPVCQAGGEARHDSMPAKTAIDRSLRFLTDSGPLPRERQGDPSISRVRSNQMRQTMDENDQDQRVHEKKLLDDDHLQGYAPLRRVLVLAEYEALVPNLTSLIHA